MAARFVTFEGLDGSGKSTQLRWVAQWLAEQGTRCEVTHEPGGTPLGEAIRSLFLDHRFPETEGGVEMLLVFASRRQHLAQVIDPALARGVHVLCDRFTDSTIAYQGHGRGVSRELIARVDALATGGRRPDLTLLFDVPAETARGRRHRGAADRLDAEGLAFNERVRAGYLEIAAAEPQRVRLIDASGDKEATAGAVREALASLVGQAPAGAR
jgi:dTMP kinase